MATCGNLSYWLLTALQFFVYFGASTFPSLYFTFPWPDERKGTPHDPSTVVSMSTFTRGFFFPREAFFCFLISAISILRYSFYYNWIFPRNGGASNSGCPWPDPPIDYNSACIITIFIQYSTSSHHLIFKQWANFSP